MISSGYVVGDGSKVRTAFHAIIDMARSSKMLADPDDSNKIAIPMAVFVYSSDGKRISIPTDTFVPTAHFAKDNLRYLGRGEGTVTRSNADLMEVQFNSKLANPLTPALKRANEGDEVYILGYPHATSDRVKFHALDAPGESLRVSFGHVISLDQSYKKMNRDPSQVPVDVKEFFQKAVIYSDADGVQGDSGGPTVNAKGEVLGTYTSGYPADGTASADHISYSSNDFYSVPKPAN